MLHELNKTEQWKLSKVIKIFHVHLHSKKK